MKPLKLTKELWEALMKDLRIRGDGVRESGAFLLGKIDDGHRVVAAWVPYDELDPSSNNYDYIRLGSNAFSALWATCAEHNLQVVADVHTHPFGPRQSRSDQAHPMISMKGHIALIVPYFAKGKVKPSDVTVNVYMGEKKWKCFSRRKAANYICFEKGEI